MSDEQKQTPNLDGRILREIALGSEGYAIRIDGESVRDPLCRGMIDLRAYPFFTSKAIAQRIVHDWNAAPQMYEALEACHKAMCRATHRGEHLSDDWIESWERVKAALAATEPRKESVLDE